MKKLILLAFCEILSAAMPLLAATEYANGYTWTYRINGDAAEILEGVAPSPTGTLVIPSTLGGKAVTSIGECAFYDCANLTSVTIPDSVTSIGDSAFYCCTGLTSVTIPDSVTSIGDSAFYQCESLAKVVVYGDSLKRIGESAFADCGKLQSMVVPKGITDIGDGAFRGVGDNAQDVNGVHWPTITLPMRFNASYWDCGGFVCSWSWPQSDNLFSRVFNKENIYVSQRGSHTLCYVGNVSVQFRDALVLPDEYGNELVFEVKDGEAEIVRIFDKDRRDAISTIAIPASACGYRVTSIGYSAFSGCSGLTSVTIPTVVKSIMDGAFDGCSALASLTVPSNVKEIGRLAFAGCGYPNTFTVVLPKWCKNRKMFYNGDEWRYLEGGASSLGRTLYEDEYIADFTYYLFADDPDGESYPSVKKRVKVIYKDVAGAGGGAVKEAWKKARTLKGKATRALADPAVGIFELKCGKANKQGVAKVSATLTGLDGKKKSYKAQSVDVGGKTATVNLDGLSVTIEGDSFSGGDGLAGGLSVSTADVGGNWTRGGAKVYVNTAVADVPAGTVDALLPDGEPVIAKGGKWAFNKAATVKLSNDKTSVEWDTAKGKTNLSGLKLTYTPKKGLFKGSFKLYALEGVDKTLKLKKYTVNVAGVVVDGNGVGRAIIKKPAAGPWIVTVE